MVLSEMIKEGKFVKFKLLNEEWAYGRVVSIIQNQAMLNVKLCNGSSFFPLIRDSIPMNDFEVKLLCFTKRNIQNSQSGICICFNNTAVF